MRRNKRRCIYLTLAPVYLAIRGLSLAAQVLILRIANVLIASGVVFLAYAIARRVFGASRRALLAAVLPVTLPGLYIDICRIGNESLSIVLASAIVLWCLNVSRRAAGTRDWLIAGALTGAALLTKGYMLAFVPLLPIAALIRKLRYRDAWKDTAGRCMGALAGWAAGAFSWSAPGCIAFAS